MFSDAPPPGSAGRDAAAPAAADGDDASDSDGGGGGGPRAARRGFDRLRDRGLSREQVESLRVYFSPQVAQFAAALPDAPVGERRLSIAAAEEQWMAVQGDASEFGLNTRRARDRAGDDDDDDDDELLGRAELLRLERGGAGADALGGALGLQQLGDVELGAPREFVWGFVMGFVLGFIMLFWLWERSVSHRQKMGILTGVTAQLSMKFVRARLAEEGELRGAGAAAAVSDADAALPPAIGS